MKMTEQAGVIGGQDQWEAFVEFVAHEKVTLLPYLRQSLPPTCGGRVLGLTVPQGYYFDYLKQHIPLVQELAERFFDRPIRVTVSAIRDTGPGVTKSLKAPTPRSRVRTRRSETVSVRLDPKLRYLAELAARKQRRTLSSFIEWAIGDALNRVYLHDAPAFQMSVNDAAENLWDVDDADRFAKLALCAPEMLDHQQQIVWKLIRESGYFWFGHHSRTTGEWLWQVEENKLIFERLREQWPTLNAVARGEEDRDAIPTIAPKEPDPPPSDDF